VYIFFPAKLSPLVQYFVLKDLSFGNYR
jgi:hypothetical protein